MSSNLYCLVRENKRYLLFFLISGLAFLFGKDFNPPRQSEEIMVRQIEELKSAERGTFDIASSVEVITLTREISVRPDQAYRLLFDLEAVPEYDGKALPSEMPRVEMTASLLSDFGEEQVLGWTQVGLNQGKMITETTFVSRFGATKLKLGKGNLDFPGRLRISNLRSYPLRLDGSSLAGLKPTIVGQSDFNGVIAGAGSVDLNKEYRFWRKGQRIGQTLRAEADIISQVDLALKFSGSGGGGNYFLELREANDRGEVDFSRDRKAYYYFNKEQANRLLIDPNRGIYRFPLAARLEAGKLYYIGISNEAANFNYLNILSLKGSRADNYSPGEAKVFVRNKPKKASGDIYFKAYGADFIQTQGEPVLTGAIIEDLGGGEGRYTYRTSGSSSDFLDLTDFRQTSDNLVFYDNVQRGISGRIIDKADFTYKFNTLYPYKRFAIRAKPTSNQFTNCLISYSADGQNWQAITVKKDSADASQQIFSEMITGDGATRTLYLKVTYDPADTMEQKIPLFGLKELTAEAELVIK
ncbi:MAG: hypothetical protein AAB360_00090 [Patescibacteria group bacterium]